MNLKRLALGVVFVGTNLLASSPEGRSLFAAGINMADVWRPNLQLRFKGDRCELELRNLNTKAIRPILETYGISLPPLYRYEDSAFTLDMAKEACRYSAMETDGFEVASGDATLKIELPSFQAGGDFAASVPVAGVSIGFHHESLNKPYHLTYRLLAAANGQWLELDPKNLAPYIGQRSRSLSPAQYQAVQAFYQSGEGTLRCRDSSRHENANSALEFTVTKQGDVFLGTALKNGEPIHSQKYAQNVRTEFDSEKRMALIQFGQPAGAPSPNNLELWLDNYFPYDYDLDEGYEFFGVLNLRLASGEKLDSIYAECRLD